MRMICVDGQIRQPIPAPIEVSFPAPASGWGWYEWESPDLVALHLWGVCSGEVFYLTYCFSRELLESGLNPARTVRAVVVARIRDITEARPALENADTNPDRTKAPKTTPSEPA